MKFFATLALVGAGLLGGNCPHILLETIGSHGYVIPTENQQSQDNFKAMIDGKPFNAEEYYAGNGGGKITINAMNSQDHGFTIQLTKDIEVGEYILNYDNADRYMFSYSNDEDGGEAMSGKLKVTSHDKGKSIIQASFEFQGEMGDGSTFSVSNGSFKFHYKLY